MKLNANDIDMLYRYALAEHFTSPSLAVGAAYDRRKVIRKLEGAGLIRHNGVRLLLTEDGNEQLEIKLDSDRAKILRGVRARKAARS